jgi:putative tryptophan/tyrosine transport system substrate-binding protein
MKRRDLVALIGGAVVGWPSAAQAQQRDGLRRLGVLLGGLNNPIFQRPADALVQGLSALNWREGENLHIVWRWTGGNPALFKRNAAELVALNPDVLVANGSNAVKALRQQTSTIPIIFMTVTDPVGQGFVNNLPHPGGMITGFTDYDPPMAGKWLEMLTQITPRVGRVAVLFNPATAPVPGLMMRTIEAAASSLAVAVQIAPARADAEIEAMMMHLAREERGGLLVLPDIFNAVHDRTIIALAARYQVPAVYPFPGLAAAGGLMCYSIDQIDQYWRAAAYVDRILKGAKPGDLPVQNPTKFELAINLKTAKALGITVAPSLLASADDVIE